MMSIMQAKRVVIKIGSSSLTYENGKPNLRKIEKLTRVISDLKNRGLEVVLVSSGAIAVGVGRLGLTDRPTTTRDKQAAAAIGQCDLMSIYDRFFSEYGYVPAQILITRDVVDNKEGRFNVINTVEALLELGAIPVINENDSISFEEILFGDNDNLSAIVADFSGADALIILTDIDGYYDCDPKTNPKAKRVEYLREITDEMISSAGGSGSSRGTGGMRTKLEAARFATNHGISVVVMSGDNLDQLYDLFDGQSVGTFFEAAEVKK